MAIDTDLAADQGGTKHHTLEPAEDFISFGGDDDAASDESSSDAASDVSSNDPDSPTTFHPQHISLDTFRRLLACYPTTVEQVHRRKAMIKLQPKPAKGSKRKADKKAVSTAVNPLQKMEFNASEKKYIQDEVDKFLTLDQWRYEGMPRIMAERREKNGGEVLSKKDLMMVMEWKLKHGVFRPMLMGMIKTNPEKTVHKCSAAAMAALSPEDPMLAPNDAFPKPSIDALAPLRGVGPATASLILSIATGAGNPRQQVPFYSDDVYIWLCLEEFPELMDEDEDESESEDEDGEPVDANANAEETKKRARIRKFMRPNGELNVKYNIAEYRKLWDACWELCERLNRAVEAEAEAEAEGSSDSTPTPALITHNDIEKTAFVLRNIAVSGYFEGRDPEDVFRMVAARKEKADKVSASASDETKPGKKKKLTKSEKKALSKKEMKAYRKLKKVGNGRNNPVKRRKVE